MCTGGLLRTPCGRTAAWAREGRRCLFYKVSRASQGGAGSDFWTFPGTQGTRACASRVLLYPLRAHSSLGARRAKVFILSGFQGFPGRSWLRLLGLSRDAGRARMRIWGPIIPLAGAQQLGRARGAGVYFVKFPGLPRAELAQSSEGTRGALAHVHLHGVLLYTPCGRTAAWAREGRRCLFYKVSRASQGGAGSDFWAFSGTQGAFMCTGGLLYEPLAGAQQLGRAKGEGVYFLRFPGLPRAQLAQISI